MTAFDEYINKYENVRLERREGILQMTLHTNGGTLQWGAVPHRELPRVFADIGADPENKVVIMTGSGEGFTGPQGSHDTIPRRTPAQWDATYWEGKHLLMNLLDIEVPMISAINGPALRHSELPLLCDIVLAAEETTFQDSGHFINGLIPGDGMHIVYPLLMGMNRGRYFLLTGQKLSAQEAKDLGLVSEVLPRERLMSRAWELAEQLAQQPALVLRYSRVLLTQHIKHLMHDLLGYGLALEGLGSAQDQLERG
ncbi:MAG TPA: enoyl-CoA hydratase/isomerase family protein [Dehalococcoidia bacterium]|nr:enoyl-CoA hydratase/isomerase family protein [Dehalococcoidia bacterium]